MAVKFKPKHVQVSKLFCDKLSFTIDYLNKNEQAYIAQEIKNLGSIAKLSRGRLYRHGVSIYQGSYPVQMLMLIQWAPIHAGPGYLRVDFNPRYADLDQVYALLCSILPSGLDDIYLKARITRFDASVDITGIGPDSLLGYAPKKQVSRVYCKSGRTETLYLGGYESDNLIVIYDKQLEVKEKNQKFKLALPVPPKPTTRVEIRLKPKKLIMELLQLQNAFQGLIIRPFSELPNVDSQTWRLFIAVAQSRGAQTGLAILDEATRKQFKQKLEAVQCDWWNPALIWSTWEDLLREVFLLNPKPLAIAA